MIESKVKKTIEKYKLLNKKEKVFVACSGGKDSTTVLYLLNKFGYNVDAFMINLHIGNWSKKHLENIKMFCKEQKINLHVADMREDLGKSMCYIRDVVKSKSNLKNCTICGIIRRWLLNKKTRELGAEKIATGHNLDDEAETIVMNYLKGNPGLNAKLGPITGIFKDKKFIPRIKPLYFCTNDEIREYAKKMKFPILYGPCPCRIDAFRKSVRDSLKSLGNVNTNIVKNTLRILPKLRQDFYSSEYTYCKLCGEPSKQEMCNSCKVFEIMNK